MNKFSNKNFSNNMNLYKNKNAIALNNQLYHTIIHLY